MNNDIRFSRPVRVAESLGEAACNKHFFTKKVLLTGEAATVATTNGRLCIHSSLALLRMFCQNVDVFVSDGNEGIYEECSNIAARGSQCLVGLLNCRPDYATYDAVLSVGKDARPDLPWTVINSNGWIARVSSGASALSEDCSRTNAVGALAASSFGATEVFKRLINLRADRGSLLDGFSFSLYSYECNEKDQGPDLPKDILLDILLVGAGAIGNGIVYLIGELPTSGKVIIIDKQDYSSENLGTCILIGEEQVKPPVPKAGFCELYLKAKRPLQVHGFKESIEEFSKKERGNSPIPGIVLNGLDSREARRNVQRLWPDLIVDGAIGPTIAQVSIHPWGRDVACLICMNREEKTYQSSEKVAIQETGLPLERIKEPDSVITVEDIKNAPEGKKEFLWSVLGQTVCSVIPEAIARGLSSNPQTEGFEPSAPFVACLSACMATGELLKHGMGLTTTLGPRYQFDVLIGSQKGILFPERRRRDCLCVTRAATIEKFRQQRRTNKIGA